MEKKEKKNMGCLGIACAFFAFIILMAIIGAATPEKVVVSKPSVVKKEVVVEEEKEVVVEEKKEVPVVEKDIDEWFDEYDSNEVLAESKYTGNKYRVTGKIGTIDSQFWGDGYYFSVRGNDFSFYNVTCYMDDEAVIMSLKEGDKVTIQGTANDWIMGISFSDCVIVK